MTTHPDSNTLKPETGQTPASEPQIELEAARASRDVSTTPARPRQTLSSRATRALFRLKGLFAFALKRQLNHPMPTALALLGVVLAVGLVTNAYVFSQAVEQTILRQKLDEFSAITGRPPFSTSVYVHPSIRRPFPLEAAEEAAPHVADTIAAEVGLPLSHTGIEIHSGNMMLQPGEGSSLFGEEKSYLGSVNLIYKSGIEEHIDILDGEPIAGAASGEELDVWMHADLAERMGLHVGEELNVGVTLASQAVPIRLKGFWQASDPEESFWFKNPDTTMKDSLLVRRQDYVTRVQPLIPAKSGQVNWHVILDDGKANPAHAREYLQGFERGQVIIDKFLPGAQLNAPPLDPLEEFVQRETTLTALLLSFNLPAYGFLLYFLVLTSVIIARWQRRDTATLVSRGTSTAGIVGLTAVEELNLFVIGFPLGIAFGMLLARLMGYTSSFLSFVERPPMPISFLGINLVAALVALSVALIARLLPAAQAARQSVVEFGREQARPTRPPFWYRTYLDFLLLVVTFYAYRQLSDKGTLALLVQERPEDLYRDPLLILVPALFILTAAMLSMRVFALLMRVVDRFAGTIRPTTPYLALRQLARRSQDYINPLLLMIVALALGVYTLSMAASLDQWLIDRMYYRVGADLTFEPYLESVRESGIIGGDWIPLPGEFRELPGVDNVTRVGDFGVSVDLPGGENVRARFLAIDRQDFPSVAWFRGDFADESLGGLMNRLAVAPDGILVPQQLLDENYIQVGDTVNLRVGLGNELTVVSPFTVVGAYDLFPTVYEDEWITAIGNLEYFAFVSGITPPHRLWVRTDDGANGKDVFLSVLRTGVEAARQTDARALIAEEQAKTERVGVFGTLSVGFLAAFIMAAVGLILFSYTSLRERLYRFAVLRAMGLKRRQVVGQVILEYAALTAYGAVAGAMIGMAASELFVPLFRVTGEEGIPLPPLIPIVAEQDIRQLAAVFAVIMVLLEVVVIARALSWRHFSVLRGTGE
jgi:putative ABC transport system permease protein